jgi:hypothetical protein
MATLTTLTREGEGEGEEELEEWTRPCCQAKPPWDRISTWCSTPRVCLDPSAHLQRLCVGMCEGEWGPGGC